MRFRSTFALALLLSPTVTTAQRAPAAAPRASVPAEARQFDFLLGEWRLSVTGRVSGLAARIHGIPKLAGTWKAWRLPDGSGIEDEVRVTDESGNPRSASHAVRTYDAKSRKWRSTSVDVNSGVSISSTAEWSGGTMTVTSPSADGAGKPYPYRTRVRYTAITPTSFHFVQERSYDDSKTWDTYLTIEATRVAAPGTR